MHYRILKPLGDLDIPPTKNISRELATGRALNELAASKPVDTFRADLMDGKCNTPAKAVAAAREIGLALAAHDYTTRVISDCEDALQQRMAVAIHADADELIGMMRPKLDRAVAALMAGRDALGDNPDERLAHVSPMLAAAHQAWLAGLKESRAIAAALREIDNGIPPFAWFVTSDTPAARQSFTAGQVWGLVCGEHEIVLNTRDEALAVIATAQAEAEAAAKKEAERKEAQRQKEKVRLRAARQPVELPARLG